MKHAAIAFAAVAALISACERGPLSAPEDFEGAKWDVEAVAALPMQEDPYLEALQSGFIQLARDELSEFDWVDGAYFLNLSRRVAEGEAIEPVDPATRALDQDIAAEMADVRNELRVFVASPGGQLRAGRQMGEAVVYFECWVQEAEEAHQNVEIDRCKDLFQETMILVRALAPLPSNLAVVLDDGKGVEITGAGGRQVLDRAFAAGSVAEGADGVIVTEAEIREAFAAALGAQPPPPVRFTVNFDLGSARLDDKGYLEIAKATEEALSRPVAEIIVTGYADAVGGPVENLSMSRARAARVRREVLRELGAKDTGPRSGTDTVSVSFNARGEQELFQDTQGPLRENRRVVILVR